MAAPWLFRLCSSALTLAGFAQLYALLAPLLTRMAAVYGTFVAFFAILAWLSISFNVLLFGACWTRVREQGLPEPEAGRRTSIHDPPSVITRAE